MVMRREWLCSHVVKTLQSLLRAKKKTKKRAGTREDPCPFGDSALAALGNTVGWPCAHILLCPATLVKRPLSFKFSVTSVPLVEDPRQGTDLTVLVDQLLARSIMVAQKIVGVSRE